MLGNCHFRSELPPELVSNIFCSLPSFNEVFALAQTSRGLRKVWNEYTTQIYEEVAPRSIPHEQHARQFLAEQGGANSSEPLTAKDVHQMLLNSRIVERAILQFEEEIVHKVRCKNTQNQNFLSFAYLTKDQVVA